MSLTLEVRYTKRMKKAMTQMRKRGKNMNKLAHVLLMLSRREVLPPRYRDHALSGDLEGRRECHIEPDWLLVYKIVEDELVLIAVNTGTHANIFGN